MLMADWDLCPVGHALALSSSATIVHSITAVSVRHGRNKQQEKPERDPVVGVSESLRDFRHDIFCHACQLLLEATGYNADEQELARKLTWLALPMADIGRPEKAAPDDEIVDIPIQSTAVSYLNQELALPWQDYVPILLLLSWSASCESSNVAKASWI